MTFHDTNTVPYSYSFGYLPLMRIEFLRLLLFKNDKMAPILNLKLNSSTMSGKSYDKLQCADWC